MHNECPIKARPFWLANFEACKVGKRHLLTPHEWSRFKTNARVVRRSARIFYDWSLSVLRIAATARLAVCQCFANAAWEATDMPRDRWIDCKGKHNGKGTARLFVLMQFQSLSSLQKCPQRQVRIDVGGLAPTRPQPRCAFSVALPWHLIRLVSVALGAH